MTIHRRTEKVENEHGLQAAANRDHAPTYDNHLLDEEEVTSTKAESWSVARGWIRMLAMWIGVVLAIVLTFLGFRFAFLLAGANASNGFVDFIYDVSDPLADPFQGIFANEGVNGGVFEPAAIISMLVYSVVAALLVAAILATASGPFARGGKLVTSRTRRREPASRWHG